MASSKNIFRIVHHGVSKNGKKDSGYSVWGPKGSGEIYHSHRSLDFCERFAQAHEAHGATIERAYLLPGGGF